MSSPITGFENNWEIWQEPTRPGPEWVDVHAGDPHGQTMGSGIVKRFSVSEGPDDR